MGVRLTGISTPFGGAEWEYTEKQDGNTSAPILFSPSRKINVFISSICGDKGKYDNVRDKLKKTIEETNLANVYLFEGTQASTISAGEHYIWSLEDSDICLFLIDNEDGVTPGVQREIDVVKRNNIKALYYFCDETSTEKTVLEQSLMGATYAKSKTVHRFEDLSQDGAQSLIDDITTIYHNYCSGRLYSRSNEFDENIQSIDLLQNTNHRESTMPKSIIKDIDKCKLFLIDWIFGMTFNDPMQEQIKTSSIDEWGVQFLEVILNNKSIKSFNTSMFLEDVKNFQKEKFHEVINIRWQAIQCYFLGDSKKCVHHLESALKLAKDTQQVSWVIQDILIDLRNQSFILDTENNCFTESAAQKQLNISEEYVHCPVLDRINHSLQEKYVEGLYKKKITSPYTVSFGNNYDQYCELLASSFLISMYNGSLTHILLFYEKIRDLLFYLSCKYDDWRFRRDLLKLAIFAGKEKEVKGLQDSYPEILNNMTALDALQILEFCNNHTISYRRISSQLLAFSIVGYYLEDNDYLKYEKKLIEFTKEWLNDDKAVVSIGQNIFICLNGIAYRTKQDTLVEICCLFIKKGYSRWYRDMFKFIGQRLNLNKMSCEAAKSLLDSIQLMMDDEKERDNIKNTPTFLCVLRNQNRELTEVLDKKILEYLPDFYSGHYNLETTLNTQEDLTYYVENALKRIKSSNEKQGKNGTYFGHGSRDIATIRAIIIDNEYNCPNELLCLIITELSNTLIHSKEDVSIKLDAVSLLICIVLKYPEQHDNNLDLFNKIMDNKYTIIDIENTFMSSNIDKISLRIALSLLSTSIGKNGYTDFLEGMSYIQNDIATTSTIAKIIDDYLDVNNDNKLDEKIEAIIVQNVLQWLSSDYIDIRWNATRILLKLLNNSENENLINQKVIYLIDNDSVFIKNLLMRNIFEVNGIYKSTQEYVISRCSQDPCFVVRMVCDEEKVKLNKNV